MVQHPNRIGVHAQVWVGNWSDPEARTAIESSRKAGYDLIEIPVIDPYSINVASTRKMLDEAGLSAACSMGLSADTDISSTYTAVVAHGERLLHNELAVARDLGAEYSSGMLYCVLGKYQQPATPEGRVHSMQEISRLTEQAAKNNMKLGIEVVNRYESNLLNTAEQALAFIDEIKANNILVHLDTYYMNIEEANFSAQVQLCGDRLGYVHVGESHRGYPGTGTIDFPAFFKAMVANNYQGTITFESFSSTVVAPGLSNTLAIWRNTWIDSMDLAQQARAFVENGLRAAQPAQIQA